MPQNCLPALRSGRQRILEQTRYNAYLYALPLDIPATCPLKLWAWFHALLSPLRCACCKFPSVVIVELCYAMDISPPLGQVSALKLCPSCRRLLTRLHLWFLWSVWNPRRVRYSEAPEKDDIELGLDLPGRSQSRLQI